MEETSPEIQSIFADAIERPSPEERAAFLKAECGDNFELRRQIEALLRAHDESDGFLEDSPPTTEFMPHTDEPITERPGTVIGPYTLLEQIGEGGFGIVFMAEQARPIRRTVALKILKPGMDTRQVVVRFEAERQALAFMEHPNIAKVFDGGETQTGRPYFVMEMVRGVSLSRYCDQNHLPIGQRLELFITVCRAVQHAHLKGIIHRDVKPSNVLVTLDDDRAIVKVIDFGLAKATSHLLTEETLCTNFAHLIGTPLYMSPEQAQLNGLDIDTRTDIYGLGVLLYELLTGTTPFDPQRLKNAAFDELLRTIREVEPPKPSTCISTLGQGVATVCMNRTCDPRRLSQLLRGELDWIVMKAIEKDRNRRYESASALAADVQRYLSDERVLACPPSLNYRLRKLVRRHKGPVIAALLLTLVLVGGSIGTTWGMIRATNAEADAVSEAKQKEEALKDKAAALTDAQERLFQALVQQARGERSSDRIGQRFEALAAIRKAAKMRVTPELRTEAIAALVQPDVEMVHEWAGWPEGSFRLDFDAGSHRYARMDRQGGVTVCRSSNGQEEVIARLPTQVKPPFGLIYMSPDGQYVAYGESSRGGPGNERVWVWKLDGPSPKVHLEVQEGVVEVALAFHSSGRRLAIGHSDGTISIYDLASATRVQRLVVGSCPGNLDFHPRESRLAAACGGAVKLFDVDTARELPALTQSGAIIRALSVAWHPSGRRLAVGCEGQKIRMWDTQTGAEAMTPWEGPSRYIHFNHAGNRLASGDWGNTAILWDATSGRQLLAIPGHSGRFSSDGRLFSYTISGNNIRLWRLAGGQELRQIRCRNAGSLDNLGAPVFEASGRILAAATRRWLCFFDLDSGEELASDRQPRVDACSPLFFDPPRAPLSPVERGKSEELGGWMTGGHSALFRWLARSDPARPETVCIGPPRQIATDGGAGYSTGASASADGQVVAVPQGNSTLVVHRDQPERRLSLGPQHDVRFAAVSPDGRWIVTCSWWWDGRSKTGFIWDAKTGERVHDLLQDGEAIAKFSPDGKWLMTSEFRHSRLWEVGTWREVRRYQPARFTFSPDSRLLAINDELGVIRLIEITTGREVACLTGPDSVSYQPYCFTLDGTRLISSGGKGLYVWDLRLIRQELKELGLDWDWPEFPPLDSSGEGTKPLKVEVDLGDLGKPSLTREQRARQAIEKYRRLVAAKPDDARVCNGLAWYYATAPEPLREVKAAVPLAEKAVKLAPKVAMYVNTLGVVYYRAGRYREAVELLRANLRHSEDSCLAHDLYFLAMSHQRLGEPARARDYYDWAVSWTRTQHDLPASFLEELAEFQAEAKELLEIKEK
jgi:serine/threonine protein kinase/WD40 repeat protein